MAKCHIFVLVLILVDLRKGEDFSANNDRKFNVVLFLAKTTTGDPYMQDSGIKYLNFVEKTRVKHCVPPSGTEDESANSYSSLESDCKQLLKTGIYALISYCRNVMGMTTAIASVQNDSFSNGLRFKKSTSEDLEIRYHHPRSLKTRFNPINQIRSQSNVITQPEHTEVFKIRSKRQTPLEEIPSFQGDEDTTPKWDVFGIMANIKLTFFGKLFEDEKNPENGGAQSTKNQLMDQLGKVSENSLFDLVKETLCNVQEGAENGFLMIIIGGCLHEICDIYSSLMQSIKHVVENTDERDTLIVVTGSCPLVDGTNTDDTQLIPVYIRGPSKTSSIAISGQLYDVPYAIKNLLADMNGGAYFTGIQTKREKRHTLKEKRNQATETKIPILLLVFCTLACVLSNN
ncbi:uncharacterized protein LOC135125874 [Zophobas morio]|uniref:uncharacterized protein LOC135125874 n=1 Tax=Zophobas morio TaxID=2755281 RepID=UPI00308329B6